MTTPVEHRGRGKRLTVPADFAAQCRTKNRIQLEAHYGVSSYLITRWRRESGIESRCPRQVKAMPKDFPALAGKMNVKQAARHWSAGQVVIRRWYWEAGIKPFIGTRVPADFVELARTMTRPDLARHYGCHPQTISNWASKAGVTLKFGRNGYPKGRKRPAQPKPASFQRQAPVKPKQPHKLPPAPRQAPIAAGLAEDAAQHLRRLTFVFHCDEGGAANPRGKFWRYGNVILTAAELMERAELRGWNPDAWRTVAPKAVSA